MDFSGGVKHWDKCKLRTALEWVVLLPEDCKGLLPEDCKRTARAHQGKS